MSARQTTLGRLLQDRREAAGYSRARIGGLVAISPGTIEGWELGRVAKPPIHDVLRLARFLRISAEDIERAVFADAGVVAIGVDSDTANAPRRLRSGSMPLLEVAFRLFRWADDAAAAAVLATTEERVRAWRAGSERMPLGDYLALSSMIGVAAAAAMNGTEERRVELTAAAEALGVALGSS